jgi:hypothetical protein
VSRRTGPREIARYPWFFITHEQIAKRSSAGA